MTARQLTGRVGREPKMQIVGYRATLHPSSSANLFPLDHIMNILFIGGNFKNKGAEAMILTSLLQFSRRIPDAKLIVASYASRESIPFGEQHAMVGGTKCSFRFIKNRKDLVTAVQLFAALFIWPRPWREKIVGTNEYLRELLNADLVVDLSGFAMTDKRPLSRRIVYAAEILTARLFGVPFVVFTQALGPFKQATSRLLARLCLPYATLVCARGESTVEYLARLGVVNRTKVIRCADSAYLFPISSGSDSSPTLPVAKGLSGPVIGIVTNSNIVERTPGEGSHNSYIRLLAGIVDHLVANYGARPVFICHEIYEERKDDAWVARQVIAASSHADTITVVSGNNSAETLKKMIGELDFLVASRFHSLVAALSLAVPSIAIAWAHKYHELFAEAGLEGFVFDAEELELERFIPMFAMAWDQRESIRGQLQNRRAHLISSAQTAFDEVEAVLRKVA
jgi:colanic acid/amylovoran biosynthesis protein